MGWLWAPNKGAVDIWFLSECRSSFAKVANETNTVNHSLVLLLLARLVSVGLEYVPCRAAGACMEGGHWSCWFWNLELQKPFSLTGASGGLRETGSQGGYPSHEGWC